MTQTYVSLDLETTGLNPKSDEIIEVGAVKFQDGQTLDSFHSLVNPSRLLPFRIQLLTGIDPAALTAAPPFSAVAPSLVSFLRNYPLVGQNIPFDLGFLAEKGVALSNPAFDLYDLASILLPQLSEYSLLALASHLGVPFPIQHRALPDALAAKDVFAALLQRACALDLSILQEVNRLTQGIAWPLRPLFQDIERQKARQPFVASVGAALAEKVGLEGVNLDYLTAGYDHGEPLAPVEEKRALDAGALTALLGERGPLARAFARFEQRPEQVAMMQAVVHTFNHGGCLMVEAGTGTGKSVAYLLPAMFFALSNRRHVVVSTNTINLQEQLWGKDVPDLVGALKQDGLLQELAEVPVAELRVAQLKGRGNYLCLRRWAALRQGQALSPNEVKVLVRILLWLKNTTTGDRAELNLTPEESTLWNRISAQAENCFTGQCPYHRRGTCLLYRARRVAETAHLIVVNHALLLSDVVGEGAILPPYDYLILDEAHHLEEEATEQLGFQVGQGQILNYLNQMGIGGGPQRPVNLVARLREHFRGSIATPLAQREALRLAQEVADVAEASRSQGERFFVELLAFLQQYMTDQGEYERRVPLNRTTRVQPGWSHLEVIWEALDAALRAVQGGMERLVARLEPLANARMLDYDSLMLEFSSLYREGTELRQKLATVVSAPQNDFVYWASINSQNHAVLLCAAPLHVGAELQRRLFSKKEAVVLTSATMSTEGSFGYLRERLGLSDAGELLLGGSFDHLASTLVVVPQDLPEPGRPGHQRAVEQTLLEVCRTAQGRTMALFTSHSSLRATYKAIQGALEQEGILPLGHGIDGSPKQLLATFKTHPKTVLMGTSSFWEGVDVVGEALSVLVIARLPFNVPTDPVFAARSETFEDPFTDYALPQAILRFKQGFGRLIRSKTDRGVLVVLDARILNRAYGEAFIKSLPHCTLRCVPARQAPPEVVWWLEKGGQGNGRRVSIH